MPTGHFTQPDSIKGQASRPRTVDQYVYATGDPINNTDRTGKDDSCDLTPDNDYCGGGTPSEGSGGISGPLDEGLSDASDGAEGGFLLGVLGGALTGLVTAGPAGIIPGAVVGAVNGAASSAAIGFGGGFLAGLFGY